MFIIIQMDGWSLYLPVVLPVPPALLLSQPFLGCQLMRDRQATGLLPACPSVLKQQLLYPRIKKKAVGSSWTCSLFLLCFCLYTVSLSPHWGERNKSKAVFVFLSVFVTLFYFGNKYLTGKALPLNAAWGLMNHIISSSKVSHVYLSCDCVKRDKT